jgi:biotin synthase
MKSEIASAINKPEALKILGGETPLYAALARAAELREKYFGKTVRIHILDNIKNGRCAEDCGYCAQRKDAGSGIAEYPLKSDEEIFADAVQAKENGAYRFCMVTSGTGPSKNGTERLAGVIRRISEELGMRVCLSAGLLDEAKAEVLARAGLDRYNHNLNTSESHYPEICTTHTYAERKQTLSALTGAGVGLCSGVIVGMGETSDDIVDAAFALKDFRVISIPVNFFIPVPGHVVQNAGKLTPEFCLRTLIVFRLIHPDSEIRIAAGREGHLRGLQSNALMVANSLFASGYLNVKGSNISETIALIRDAGYEPEIEGMRTAPEGAATAAADFSYAPENFPALLKFRS